MNKIIEEIENQIKDDIAKLGFNIEYIEYVKEMNTQILRIVIEKIDKSNIDVEDCEKVSRKVEDMVDILMKEKIYTLEVASPGLERQLKNLKLYNKYVGYDIHVNLFKKTDILKDVKLKEFDAKLVEINDNVVTLKTKIESIDITFKLNINDIAIATTIYDYKALFKK